MGRKAKYTEVDWVQMKLKYEMGKSAGDIAREHGVNSTLIYKKIKEEGWVKDRMKEKANAHAAALGALVNTTAEVEELRLSSLEKSEFQHIILDKAGLDSKNKQLQHTVMGLMQEAAKVGAQLLKNNPSGLYVKSQGPNGTSWGRTTEIVKDFAPVINGINAHLNPNAGIAINNNQQNNTTTEESPIKFYIPENNR